MKVYTTNIETKEQILIDLDTAYFMLKITTPSLDKDVLRRALKNGAVFSNNPHNPKNIYHYNKAVDVLIF